SGRLAHLDRLKILLTAGVIAAHAAMSYGAAGTWLYEEDSLSEPTALLLSALVGGGVMFVLGLFFLMAGILTTGPLERRGPRRFLVSRLWRLGVPVLVYAVFVWPMLQWLIEAVRSDAPTPWAFYQRELSGDRWQSRGTGPMWFVAILLVVSVGWCLWRWRTPAFPSTTSAGTTVTLAAIVVAVGTFFVRTRFPIDSPQFLDVHVWIWPQSVALFVLGAVGAERGWISPVSPTVLRRCRLAVLAALLLLVLLIVLSDGPEHFKGGWHWEAAGLAVCEGAISVSVSLLVLDWSRRHVVAHGRFERSLAESAYGAFVAQGPVLVIAALLLIPLDVAGDLKFLILATVGVVGSFACGRAAVALSRALPR
ncbi:MAG: acyltransferase family protein, partial [Aeromicrobium sp.]